MREPAQRLNTLLLNGPSLFKRIRDNFRSLRSLPWAPLPAASAPIHLLDTRRSPTTPAAQLGSTLLHLSLCTALLWLALHPPKSTPLPPNGKTSLDTLTFDQSRWLRELNAGSLGRSGSSGGHDALPPTAGELAPPSRFALTAPHQPDSRSHPLTVPITIADPEAPDFVRTVTDPGLPWMRDKNNSESLGEHGTGNDHGMGDGPGDGSGIGNDRGPFSGIASQVVCRICPDPLYSDEARKTKLQGSVLVAVLVGADGRAKDIRILRGLGMGLDENAILAIRSWQFTPAKDAAHRPMDSWIKVETMFRLF